MLFRCTACGYMNRLPSGVPTKCKHCGSEDIGKFIRVDPIDVDPEKYDKHEQDREWLEARRVERGAD